MVSFPFLMRSFMVSSFSECDKSEPFSRVFRLVKRHFELQNCTVLFEMCLNLIVRQLGFEATQKHFTWFGFGLFNVNLFAVDSMITSSKNCLYRRWLLENHKCKTTRPSGLRI